MDSTANPQKKQRPDARRKPAQGYLLESLRRIAAAFRVELSEETQGIYLNELAPFPQASLDEAVGRTIREWTEASKMPTLHFILERIYAAQNQPRTINDSHRILERGDKPADWEPLTDEEKAGLNRSVREGAKILQMPGGSKPRDGAA